jgi:hypothetical protein
MELPSSTMRRAGAWMPYLSPALNVMTTAARKAGRGLIRDFGELENLQVSFKGTADFVSSADQRTERLMILGGKSGDGTNFDPTCGPR